MRRFAVILAGIILAGLLSQSALAGSRIRPDARTSWGKAGVSLEQYWIDASLCGHQAAAVDLTGTKPAKALVYASRTLANADNAGEVAATQRLVSPEIQWNRAATIMQRALEMCLTDRGYHQFRLTGEQARQLRMFEKGSFERREFLHNLASDPMVLEKQAYD